MTGPAGAGDDLAAIRAELDEIDAGLVELVARRLRIVDQVAAAKAVTARPVRDTDRERQVLDRAEAAAREHGVPAALVRAVFRELLNHAVDRQVADLLPGSDQPIVVAFQGTQHTDNHRAARKFMTARREEVATFVGHPTHGDAVASVQAGRGDIAVVPIESTAAGSITEVYDLLQRSGVAVVGEETLRVEPCLVGLPDARIDRVRRVLSDARGLEQCAGALRGLPMIMPVACRDSSEAMRLVAESRDPSWAAIGSAEAADAYGLVVLRRRIAEPSESYLRFLVLARRPVAVDPRIACKTSIVLVTTNGDGALLRCLQILADSGRSMTKLESRPLPGRPFEYLFFLDFEGNVADDATQQVLDALRAVALSVHVLGSYPAKITRADPGAEPTDSAADGIEAVVVRARD